MQPHLRREERGSCVYPLRKDTRLFQLVFWKVGGLVDTNSIAQLIEPSLTSMGYRLVRVAVTGGRRMTLQIMAERLDNASISLEDCEQISHSVSALLDVADPIAGAYMLEVSSPGIDRPLVRAEDYDRFSGLVAKIELAVPVNGRKRYRGRLLGTAEGAICLLTDAGETRLPFEAVMRAKLVLTDDLIAAARGQNPQSVQRQTATRSQAC